MFYDNVMPNVLFSIDIMKTTNCLNVTWNRYWYILQYSIFTFLVWFPLKSTSIWGGGHDKFGDLAIILRLFSFTFPLYNRMHEYVKLDTNYL